MTSRFVIGDKIIAWIERRLAQVSGRVHRAPWTTLLLVALGCGLSVVGARALQLDTNLTALLPASVHSVQDLATLEERFGGVGYVAVVGQSKSVDGLIAFATDAANQLGKIDGVSYVLHRRHADFFADKALYYLDEEDLDTIVERLETRVAWERNRRNPMYMDLEESSPPPLDFNDLTDKHKKAGGVHGFIQAGKSAVGPDAEYYLDSAAGTILVLIKPNFISTDLEPTSKLVATVRQWAAELDATAYAPDLTVELSGRYVKRVDEQLSMSQDLQRASMLALLGVLLYLFLHFRRGFAVVLMITPLLVGLAWTFGVAGVVFGSLNILTAFIGAILLGLGIDHGIHFIGRFESEYARKQPLADVIEITFSKTGRAVVIAGLTTTVAFAGLAFSEFRAFHEFGVIAASGMVLLVLAYLLVLPALLTIALRWGWQPSSGKTKELSTYGNWLGRHGGKVLMAGTAVSALILCGLPFASFDYNFDSMQSTHLPSYKIDKVINGVLGHTQAPIVALTDSEAQERHLVAGLRRQKQIKGADSTVDFVVGKRDLVPDGQVAKQPKLEQIAEILARVRATWLAEEQRPWLRQLKAAAGAQPFVEEDIPWEMRRQFEATSPQKQGSFVLVYTNTTQSDGLEITALANEIRSVEMPLGSRVMAAGETMVLADILGMVWSEAPPVLASVIGLVFLVVWLLLGRVRMALLSLLPALVTLLLATAILPMIHQEFNYINIVAIPVLFGIGVDGGVHMVTRLNAGGMLPEVISETGRAIAGAIVTTALGFGAMLSAHQPGLFSLGVVAIVGLAVNMLASLVILPSFLAWRARSEKAGDLFNGVPADG